MVLGNNHRNSDSNCTDRRPWGLQRSPQRASSEQHNEQMGVL